MKVDLRDKLKMENKMRQLPYNHRKLFEKRLKKEFDGEKSKNAYSFLKIAASIAIILSIGLTSYLVFDFEIQHETVKPLSVSSNKINSISDISPDLKKIEDYYLAHINYQIAKIKVTDDNRDLLELYLSQLGVLQQEYEDLNLQLNTDEINEETIEALIENLQLRLQLLKQLKKKLQIIKNLNSQENGNKQA